MKYLIAVVAVCVVLASLGSFSSARADSAEAASALVQALEGAGYRANPPTPVGETLDASKVSCHIDTSGDLPSCEIMAPGTSAVTHASGDTALAIIQAMESLGTGLSLTNLHCSIDTRPRPTQPYDPEWYCSFE